MRTAPWLMACALLFWGWENGLLLWGWIMAVAVECARYSRTRWEFSDTDLNRICDLCWALCAGAALLLYSAPDRMMFVFRLAQWLPVCFFPLILAQAYGNRPTMPLSVFWWLLRRSPRHPAAHKSYNISYCYFAICLLGVSAATSANALFYPGITLLVALALSSTRPRRVSIMPWLMLLSLVATAGFFSHQGLRQLQTNVEERLGIWIAGFFKAPQPDSRECPTEIGSLSRMALSGKIVFRVRPEPGGFAPGLLREATWDTYKDPIWSASNSLSVEVNPGSSDTIKLLRTNSMSSEVEIAGYYDSGRGLLALPHGTFEIKDLPYSVKTNNLGEAIIEDGPGLVDFTACFGPGRSIDSPPSPRDLALGEREVPALSNIVAELKLGQMKTDQQRIRAIHKFFADHFTYTLDPPRNRNKLGEPTWMSYFLTKLRRGHCQYFATATVLLLREAGIYSRYVTGFAVPESARHGDTYIVRERDAHAWALAYNKDTQCWEEVDNTPAGWDKADGAPPWWEPASDALSNLYFQFSKWRWDKTSYAQYSSWMLVPVVLYLVGRIVLNQRRKRLAASPDDAANRSPWPGLDSELFLINLQLAEAQLSRLPNEPLRSWQERLEQAFPGSDRLRRIFRLHRCLRFDPRGLEKDDRETLRSEARQWLAEFTVKEQEKKRAMQPASQ